MSKMKPLEKLWDDGEGNFINSRGEIVPAMAVGIRVVIATPAQMALRPEIFDEKAVIEPLSEAQAYALPEKSYKSIKFPGFREKQVTYLKKR